MTDIFCPKLVQPGCAGPFGPVDAWGPRHDEQLNILSELWLVDV